MWFIRRLLSKHANVWLLLDNESTWENNYIVGFTKVNTIDPIKMKSSLPENFKADGVLCWDEIRIIPSAKLAKLLDLPGGDVDTIMSCRDKHLTRTLLDEHNLAQPKCVLTTTLEEAQVAASDIGYPVIVKPRAMAASYGVCKVENKAQLEQAFKSAANMTEVCENYIADSYREAKNSDSNATEHYYRKGVLIEQCVIGTEVSIDSAVVNGELTPLFIARKQTGFYPHFEEIGHVVNTHDTLLEDKDFINYLQQVHKALNFNNGCTHTEIMLTEDGPKLIEVNARLGGDLIPYVGQIATDIDLGKVVVDVTCGKSIEIAKVEPSVAAIRFFYPESDCTVEDISIKEDKLHSTVKIATLLAVAGQKLLLPPKDNVGGRFGYCIVKSTNLDECIKTAIATKESFELSVIAE